MVIKKNILFILLSVLIVGCTLTRVSSRTNKLPTKSFVKILHTTTIKSCNDVQGVKCPTGAYAQTGSGMAIEMFKNQMTVLTAGHVCDSQPDPRLIKEHVQTIQVLDYNNMKHQAWPIHTSLDDGVSNGDLCLLWVPTLEVKKAKISIFTPKVGDELYYVGSPLGIYHPPTVPIFKGIYSGKISGSSAMVTFPAIGGSSGAAVFDKNNRIVGVVFAANIPFHHISIITTHKSLRLFLSQAKRKFSSTQQ